MERPIKRFIDAVLVTEEVWNDAKELIKTWDDVLKQNCIHSLISFDTGEKIVTGDTTLNIGDMIASFLLGVDFCGYHIELEHAVCVYPTDNPYKVRLEDLKVVFGPFNFNELGE